MESTFLTCPICYDEFDTLKHSPRIIPICGHTICSACLTTLLQNPHLNQRKCPIDAQLFSPEFGNLEAFKVNYIAKQILEMQSQKDLCLDHNEEMTFACLVDKRKICNICVSDGGHQTHKIKSLKAIKSETTAYLKKIKDVLEGLDDCHLEANQTSKEMKMLLLKRVKDEFDQMRKLLAEKEQDINFQINTAFYNQEMKIDNLLGATSDMRKSLESQASDLDNIFTSQEFLKDENSFEAIKESLANFKAEFDSKAIEEERDLIKTRVEQTFQTFKEVLNPQVQVLSDLKISLQDDLFKGLSRGVFKDPPMVSSSNNDDRMETEEVSSLFKINTYLAFNDTEEELTISSNTLKQCDTLVDIEKWKNVKNVTIKLAHKLSDEEDIHVLSFIWRRLKGTGWLKLEFNLSEVSHKILQVLTQTRTTFSRIEITLKKQDLTNEREAALLIGMILRNNSNLKKLILCLDESKLTKQVVQAFLEDQLASSKTLEELSLSLTKTNIVDDDICQLPLNLSNLKHLYLSFSYTDISSMTIEWLARKPLKNLENIQLYLSSTKIGDDGMKALFSKREKMKRITLDLGSTKITNQTIKDLAQAILSSNGTLEWLELGLCNTSVTDEGLFSIFISIPKLIKLRLIFASTEITDESIKVLAQKTLASATNLKSFRLDLNRTDITDSSMIQVFNNIGDLEELDIKFPSTEVTDDSVAPFIIDKVLEMTKLAKFEIDASDTQVSPDVQARIKELQTTIKNKAGAQ